jgi:hypothetical protein
MSLRSKEVAPVGDHVKHRGTKLMGEVLALAAGARRRVRWEDGSTTVTHIGDLLERVD